jgi:hypothetical protein
MFEENSIVRCTTNKLPRFIEGNLYRVISKDFEHTDGYKYSIVNDAGVLEYFTEEEVNDYFTDKDVPDSITYFSDANAISDIEDNVNHPSHYTWLKDLCGIEVIDITRHMDFDLGCVLKYVLRAGKKKEMGLSDIEKEIEDLSKAKFYLNDKIAFLKDEQRNLEKSRQI